MTSTDMRGKTALITGTGQGIGAEIARHFADHGASLALNWHRNGDNELDRLREYLDMRAVEYTLSEGDISDETYVSRWVTESNERLSSIDILVNVAGVLITGRVQDFCLVDWEHVFQVNATAVFLTTRAVLPYMLAAQSGRIINIASQHGQVGATEKSAYAASKAAVIGFTKSVAKEVAPHGINANCVAPGPVATGMVEYQSEDEQSATRARLPLRRYNTTQEVAASVLFLASSTGSAYTGQTLGPNSGAVML